jgi:hypothetical protein
MLARPVFIVGTMRSGSTLLRLILDAHPNISISEETGFMGALAATKQIPNWQHGRGWYERIGWSEEEIDGRLRAFYAELFERRALAQGKNRWGEKTPFHSEHIGQMATVFPDSVFVAIVRHPGAVVHSLIRKFHYGVEDAAAYWDDTNKEILRRGLELGDDRFALLRYEDLVGRPEETLRELVDWLGERWSEDLLRHNQVQAAQGAPRIAAGNTRTRDPIKTELADRWAAEVAAPERRVLADRAGEIARFLGYDPAVPGAPGPLVGEDSAGYRWLLTGSELARRHQAAGGPSLDRPDVAVIMPEMNAAELAKRLRSAEAALGRIRSRRAVRWTNSLRKAQRQVTGLPIELRSVAGLAFRRSGGSVPPERSPRE